MDAGLCCEVGFRLEGNEYKLPENEIVVDIEIRDLKHHSTESSTSAPIPAYLHTCYDEFSREFCSYSVADSTPASVPLVNYEETSAARSQVFFPSEIDSNKLGINVSVDLNLGQKFLQNYHPCYSGWNSAFKHSPPSTRHMLGTGPRVIATDNHFLFEINPNYAMKQEFEPIFGSMTLYTFMNDCCVRLSESFHFDCTTKHVKIKYKDVYPIEDNSPEGSDPSNPFIPTNLSLFTIPDEFKKKDIFIVMQLTKVLTADAEKAAAPYIRSSGYPAVTKHLEACRRLYPFRQPLGLAVLRLADQKPTGAPKQSIPIKFPFFAMKSTLNDHYLGTLIRDMYPVDGPPHNRLEALELFMSIRIFDLGRENQLPETLMTVPGLVDYSTGRMRGRLIPSQFKTKRASELRTDDIDLGALGHYFRQGAIIKETKETYIEKKVIAVSGVGDSACIRYVSVLPPIGSRASVDPVRQLKSSIDNTLYIYPLVFEKFSHRNLCIKIQLVEFISSVPGRLPDPTQPYHILRNIYSTMPGAPFSTSAFTTVSYHSKLPILNEEIKVRLPDVLTDRHWLIFTVHHVHVKQKTATNKSFLGIVSFTPGELLDTSSTIVGAGFLPLMADGKSLLGDSEYPVHVYDFGESVNHSIAYPQKAGSSPIPTPGTNSPSARTSSSPGPGVGTIQENLKRVDLSLMPCLRVRTRALCSVVSSCRKVQAALALQPPPLGRLPTSVMPFGDLADDDSQSMSTNELLRLSFLQKTLPSTVSPGGSKLNEDSAAESKLAMVTGDLGGASPLEVTRFFLPLMRQLTRTLCGGTCVYSRSRANPYAHTSSRCQAFLALLQVLGKVVPEVTLYKDKDKPGCTNNPGGGIGSEELLLQAYVEFFLDEEVHNESLMTTESIHRNEFSLHDVPHTGSNDIVGGDGIGAGIGIGIGTYGINSNIHGKDKGKELGSSGGILSGETTRVNLTARDNDMIAQLKQALCLDSEDRELGSGSGMNGPSSIGIGSGGGGGGLNKPPLPNSNRNSLRVPIPIDSREVEIIPQSVFTPLPIDSAPYTPLIESNRNSLRIDMTVLESGLTRPTSQGIILTPRSSILTGSSIASESVSSSNDGRDSSEKSQKSIIRKMNSDGSADSPDMYDNNLFGVLDNDESHSSDSEEDEEEEEEEEEEDEEDDEDEEDNGEDDDGFDDNNERSISGIYSVDSVLPGQLLRSPSGKIDNTNILSSCNTEINDVNFDDQVKFMDMNIQALNEEGLNNEADLDPQDASESMEGEEMSVLGESSPYRDNADDDCMALVSKVWSKSEDVIHSNSDKIFEKNSAKKITFLREDGRVSKVTEVKDNINDDDNDDMRSPVREKGVTSRKLPAAQIFEEIALQLCLQAERAVLEAAVEDAVMFTVLSSSTLPPDLIIEEEDMLSDDDSLEIIQFEKCLARKNVRWWGNDLHTKNKIEKNKNKSNNNYNNTNNNDNNDDNSNNNRNMKNKQNLQNLDINSISINFSDSDSVSIVEHSTPSAYISSNLPFDSERSWFESIESGFDLNDNNYTISCNQNPSKTSPKRSPGRDSGKKSGLNQNLSLSTNSIQSNDVLDINTINVRADGNLIMNNNSTYESDSNESAQLAIISPEPRYNRISGYASRQHRQSVRMSLSAPQIQSLLDCTASPPAAHNSANALEQWWPWLYEVLTHQWCSLLLAFQAKVSSGKVLNRNAPTTPPNGLDTGNAGTKPVPIRVTSIAPYPLDVHSIQKNSTQQLKDTRTLLADQGSLLFQMILKSLILRISREGKRTPVILDEQYAFVLENLISAIATEIVTNQSTGISRYRRLNVALAVFLRDLFAIVSPSQVSLLVDAYFKAMHSHYNRSKAIEIELRLQFLEEFSLFDHMLAANFPYTLDAPLSIFSHQISSRLYPLSGSQSIDDISHLPSSYSPQPSDSASLINSPIPGDSNLSNRGGEREQVRILKAEKGENVVLAYSSRGIRGTTMDPSPHWLAHLIISETMAAYRSDDKKLKNQAVTVLRDLLVRHSYDMRYQSKEACYRIAVVYLPLVAELVIEAIRLALLPHNNTERKELLAILLSILGDLTSRILRECIRQLCQRNNIAINNYNTPMKSSKDKMKKEKKNNFDLPIMRLLLLLHLSLDTFEFPETVRREKSENEFECNISTYKQVTCPSINAFDPPLTETVIETVSNFTDVSKRNSGSYSGRITSMQIQPIKPRSGSGDHTANAGILLDRLESRMQNRRALTNNVAGWSGGDVNSDDRRWVGSIGASVGQSSGGLLSTVVSGKESIQKGNIYTLTPTLLQIASKNISKQSIAIVVHVIKIVLEECPQQILSLTLSSLPLPLHLNDEMFTDNYDGKKLSLHTDNGNDGSKDFLSFMQMVLSVLLHGISGNQCIDSYRRLFECSCLVLKRFGFRLFLAAASDSLQDWLRSSLVCCSHKQTDVSKAATEFLSYLMLACFHYTGSLSKLSIVFITIFDDVLTHILESNREYIRYNSDEIALLLPLQMNLIRIRDAHLVELKSSNFGRERGSPPRNKPAYASAVVTLMNNLLLLFRATGYLRRHVTHPVGHDWLATNMLDGPFDDRSTAYMHYLRNSRKAVTTQNVVQVDLEAVMEVFSEAAEIFDPISLPRFRMRWLENLARLHEQKGNKSEGAEIRWRIFKICESCRSTWSSQWVPRQPLDWVRRGSEESVYSSVKFGSGSQQGFGNNWQSSTGSGSDADSLPWLLGFDQTARAGSTVRSFLTVLSKAITAPPMRAWLSPVQFFCHMETALSVSAQRFGNLNLIHLAERASYRLLDLYRDAGKVEKMAAEYKRAASAFKDISDLASSHFALGTFYSVLYLGLGVPAHLRGKEFIYRNANNLHVSEFQAFIKSHLVHLVTTSGSEVVFLSVNRLSNLESYESSKHANVVMTSVKPIFQKQNKDKEKEREREKKKGSGENSIDSSTLTNAFRYSIPYTQDRSKVHSRGVDQQWKRTTILTVKESFPGIFSRQPVLSFKYIELSPIEVSLEDIEERVEIMQKELDLEMTAGGGAADTNNLMRLIQGTVAPQVNAGAGEVARVFLSPMWFPPSPHTSPIPSQSPTTPHTSSSSKSLTPTTPPVSSSLSREARSISPSTSGRSATLNSTKSVGSNAFSEKSACNEEKKDENEEERGRRIMGEKKALFDLGERQKLKLKMTLIEFLFLSKCLLIKSRRLLVDVTQQSSFQTYPSGSYDPDNTFGMAPSSPTVQVQRFNSALNLYTGNSSYGSSSSLSTSSSTNVTNNSNNGNTVSGSVNVVPNSNSKGALLTINSLLESNIVWQKEMEKGYDNLLDAILPLLGDIANTTKLQR